MYIYVPYLLLNIKNICSSIAAYQNYFCNDADVRPPMSRYPYYCCASWMESDNRIRNNYTDCK